MQYTKLKLSQSLLKELKRRFIAFDTETTGLDSWYDRIIEVGAVLFEDGKPVSSFGSLMKSVTYVPYAAQSVNHITNKMVRSAPSPEKVYAQLVSFLGDALDGRTVIVGHNAAFDMKFLSAEFARFGYTADILYADTCSLAKPALPNLSNYTQDNVACQLGVRNQQSHRAETDALTCGSIMVELLPLLEESEKITAEAERRAAKKEKAEPDEKGKELCKQLMEESKERNLLDTCLCFQKAGKLLHVKCVDPLFSVNAGGRHPYVVVEKRHLSRLVEGGILPADLDVQPCSAGEAKLYEDSVRVWVAGEMEPWVRELLAISLEEKRFRQEAILRDAARRWEIMREMELCWK